MRTQRWLFAFDPPTEPPVVFVKCGSHRARQRLTALVGTGPLPCYFDYNRPSKGGYFLIPADKLAAARKIPGVTRAQHPDDLSPCWS